MFARVKGTEDILDLRLHNFVLDQAKKHLIKYNFSEIQTPILEHTNLFIRSLGTETDVVTKEMYTFATSTGESICLRPEVTAPTMRAYLEHHREESPWKVFSYGPMFRHERPQKGRWRQFSQLNIEVIKASSIFHDASLIAMLDHFFSETLQLNEYVLKLNFLGNATDRINYVEALRTFLIHNNDTICVTCRRRVDTNIMRVLDCKIESCKTLYVNAPKTTDFLGEETKREWLTLKDTLTLLSVSFIEDSQLVRGLDYYNKTVFEFSSQALGAQNAFCGGGRYDGLAEQLGASEPIPSLGASIGMGRLLMLLEEIVDTLQIPQPPALNLIIPMTSAQVDLALLFAEHLRFNHFCIDVLLDEASMKSMMRKANKLGAKQVLIIGDDEQKAGAVTIKNMMTGASMTVPQVDAIKYLL